MKIGNDTAQKHPENPAMALHTKRIIVGGGLMVPYKAQGYSEQPCEATDCQGKLSKGNKQIRKPIDDMHETY